MNERETNEINAKMQRLLDTIEDQQIKLYRLRAEVAMWQHRDECAAYAIGGVICAECDRLEKAAEASGKGFVGRFQNAVNERETMANKLSDLSIAELQATLTATEGGGRER